MTGIRADANSEISIGHIMRCLSIAEEMRRLGESVIFFISDESSGELIKSRGFEYVCLENDYRDKNGETKLLLEELSKRNITRLLLDSYEIEREYMHELNSEVTLIYLDDLLKFDYEADTIINYSVDAIKEQYEGSSCSQYLMGSRYTPLRAEIRNAAEGRKEEIRNIYLSSGGSDHFGMVLKMAEGILKEKMLHELKVHAVVGRYYPDMDELKKLSDNNPGRIVVHHNIPKVWEVMAKCDAAVSASGTTVAELCAAGVPVICFITADNQINGIKAVLKSDAAIYAGNAGDGAGEVVRRAVAELIQLVNGELDRDYYIKRGHELFDGLGAKRIAEAIMAINANV